MNFNLCYHKLIGIKGSFVNNINHYWVQWIINIPYFNKSVILIFWSGVFRSWYISKHEMTALKSHRNHLVLLEEVEISARKVWKVIPSIAHCFGIQNHHLIFRIMDRQSFNTINIDVICGSWYKLDSFTFSFIGSISSK